MQYKLPIVANDLGAVPDFLVDGESGYSVKVDDIDQLARALIDLLNDPDKCRRFGERGFRLAQDVYNWDRVGASMREHILSSCPVLRNG